MLAIVELGGNQFIVKVGEKIDVDNQNVEVGSVFDTKALLISDIDGKNAKVGTPLVDNSKIEFKVLENFKDDKVRVFKMKSKKRYSRNKGFRAQKTRLEVIGIS